MSAFLPGNGLVRANGSAEAAAPSILVTPLPRPRRAAAPSPSVPGGPSAPPVAKKHLDPAVCKCPCGCTKNVKNRRFTWCQDCLDHIHAI
ncbi:hypothetical protein G6O67_004250 [Ophiocordyceps sinensis]|uniref:Uncharacterized protein n=2 Tax=Ophiocordyceps sinensis TaxID=72228 RepID=A0A8H4PMN9_9HYPO|nr:hypothetical protein OCS_04551 [Ophiocordyceps sinensis CO18]KAF4507787.1 hypothetical protein G6O67_004250 [Ophiocordyceps sinensis]